AGGSEPATSVRAGLAYFLEAIPGLPRPAIPGVVHLDAQGVVVGGSVIQAVGLDVATAPEGWRIEEFAALLPGETRVDLRGLLGATRELSFTGHGRLESARPSAFAAWWRGQAGSAATIDGFAVEADLDLGDETQSLTNLVVAMGGGTVEGLVERRRFSQSGEIFATVDLAADRADLVEARALVELLAGDALTAGRIDRLNVSLRADALSAGGIEARSVVIEGGREQDVWHLRRLAIADLAGARVDAHGSVRDPLGDHAGRLEATIDAEDITGAAEFLRRLVPDNQAVAHFRRIAPALSPVHADISVESGSEPARLAVHLTGSLAETRFKLTGSGTGKPARPESLDGNLALTLDSGNTAALLAQLGLDPVPVQAGPARIDAGFEGAAEGGKLRFAGSVAGIDFSYAAETALRDGDIALQGHLDATTSDLDPALLLAGLAVQGIGEGHAGTAAGQLEITPDTFRLALSAATFDGQNVGGTITAGLKDGIDIEGALTLQSASLPVLAALGLGSAPGLEAEGWSDDAFGAVLPPGVSLDLGLTADELGLGLPLNALDAELQLAVSRNALSIDLARADFAGGVLKGAIAATFTDNEADLAIRGSLQDGELQALLWERDGLPAASGELDLSVAATGRGRSTAGVLSSLSGSGSFAVSEGRLNALNPEALEAAVRAGETGLEPDEDKVREEFAIRFGSGALPFGRAAGSFSINSGVLRVGTVSVSAAGTDVLADATLDLNTLTLASEWSVRTGQAGADEQKPTVEIRFAGPIRKPERQVDVQPLLDLVHNRHLQRQLKELEALEQARRLFEAAQGEKLREETERRRLDAEAAGPRRSAPAAGVRQRSREISPPDLEAPLDLLPDGAASRAGPAADLVQQIGPAVQDILEVRP
ncbi:MAG TPA: AsmA-like C-terminal region-containing protein, partial [Afifellaceae bacterium]|nr:AsmA-like C-terminal region-containing protein [Afifellaceae bacterium]